MKMSLQLLLLDNYNSTCSYMCLHPVFAVAIGKGVRRLTEGLDWGSLFLWMNSCRAVRTSICRVQRLVLGELR